MADQQRLIEVLDIGTASYQTALQLQESIWKRLVEQPQLTTATIILVEHPHVITFGRSEKGENLLVSRADLQRYGIELFAIGRGGKATYHGPGQLVAYPIAPIQRWRLSVKCFVAALEKAMTQTCAHYGVPAQSGGCNQRPVGCWVENRKIGQVGVQVKRGVTMHGLALNVCNDLSYFQLLNPCGFNNLQTTTLRDEMHSPPPAAMLFTDAKKIMVDALGTSLIYS